MYVDVLQAGFLLKVGLCVLPAAAGFYIANELAHRSRMHRAAAVWRWLGRILAGLACLCLLTELLVLVLG